MRGVYEHGLETLLDTDVDNSVQTLKSGPGEIHWLQVDDNSAADSFLQLFDEEGTITVGTTTPKLSLKIDANESKQFSFPYGVRFHHSIKYALTTTVDGNTDPGTGGVLNAAFI